MAQRASIGRRTRIVATLGPACWSEPTLGRMLAAGVDVVRLNFSHGTHEQHARGIAAVRAAERRLGKPVAIFQDLCGPKIRTGALRDGSVALKRGRTLIIDPDCTLGDADRIGINYDQLAAVVRPGRRLLLDDGRIELRVTAIDGTHVVCRVVRGDKLGGNKGVNLPGTALPIPAVTEKDFEDLAFGVAHDVDAVALSFVRSPSDVAQVQFRIRELGGDQPVIAKLERAEAIQHLDAIIEQADGVMVARGDMAVELSPEEVPVIQKRAIARAMALGKPIITATQMLESMLTSTRPTRAEASDVANAILDGTDAIMLSEETAIGSYPVEVVKTMHRIALRIERSNVPRPPLPALDGVGEVPRSLALSACRIADTLHAARIIVFTHSGSSARYVSKCRPGTPILAVTTNVRVARRLNLLHGIQSLVMDLAHDTDGMLNSAAMATMASGLVRPGDRVVFVFGQPVGVPGNTNTVKIHTFTAVPLPE